MGAECEMPIRAGMCGVAAIGRCSRCSRAACLGHLSGYHSLCQACRDEEHAAYIKQLTENAAPYVSAVAQAIKRRLAAVQALNDLGAPGLVTRRMRVGYDRRRFGRDTDHYETYESAWPVGECVWIYLGNGYQSLDKVSYPSGVTPNNHLVPMLHPISWEVPIERASPQVRLDPAPVKETEQAAEAHEMIAAALDELVRSNGRR
jgi:hypothetical protein